MGQGMEGQHAPHSAMGGGHIAAVDQMMSYNTYGGM